MRKHFTAALALFLVFCILTGCTLRKEDSQVNKPTDPETTQPATMPPQETMPTELLQEALVRAEYAMIAAALSIENKIASLDGWAEQQAIYVGDIDSDGQLELAHSGNPLFFDMENNRDLSWAYTQIDVPTHCLVKFHLDKDNTFYMEYGVAEGDSVFNDDGSLLVYQYRHYFYDNLRNGEWINRLDNFSNSTQEAWVLEDSYDYKYGDYIEKTEAYKIDEKEVSKETYEQHTASLQLTPITTKYGDYTANLYDACYTDSILSALETRFSSDFGATSVRRDIDGDGLTETVIAAPNLFAPYISSLSAKVSDYSYILPSVIDTQKSHTGILIADVQGDKLSLTAHCSFNTVSLNDSTTISYKDNYWWFGSSGVYAPSIFETLNELDSSQKEIAFNGLEQFLKSCGYSEIVLKTADISDAPGDELLCLCRKNGQWHVLVLIFRNGVPEKLETLYLNDAVFITQVNGKQALLTYSQNIHSTGGQYYYNICRFDADGNNQMIALDNVSYSNDDNAQAVADFFHTLSQYLVKIIVLSDPYQLQGNRWISPEQVDHGTPPAEPEPEQTEDAVMGFVEIQDPGSWLNLREGPGTQYPCILIDPSNPDSFVRQALGSPVTVLETIETDDAENPVWLKVRITYADKVIEGYSSKTYIRLAEE